MQGRGKDKPKPQGSIPPTPHTRSYLISQLWQWVDQLDGRDGSNWVGRWPLGQFPTNDNLVKLKSQRHRRKKTTNPKERGCSRRFFHAVVKNWMPLSFVRGSGQSFHSCWWSWWWCWCWRSSGWLWWEGTKWRGWLGPGRSPTGRNITSATSVISSAPPPWSSSALSSSPKCSCVGNINFLECFNFLPC